MQRLRIRKLWLKKPLDKLKKERKLKLPKDKEIKKLSTKRSKLLKKLKTKLLKKPKRKLHPKQKAGNDVDYLNRFEIRIFGILIGNG